MVRSGDGKTRASAARPFAGLFGVWPTRSLHINLRNLPASSKGPPEASERRAHHPPDRVPAAFSRGKTGFRQPPCNPQGELRIVNGWCRLMPLREAAHL